jgi:hypothetical protein
MTKASLFAIPWPGLKRPLLEHPFNHKSPAEAPVILAGQPVTPFSPIGG